MGSSSQPSTGSIGSTTDGETLNKQVTVFEMANAIINADTLFQTQE